MNAPPSIPSENKPPATAAMVRSLEPEPHVQPPSPQGQSQTSHTKRCASRWKAPHQVSEGCVRCEDRVGL